MARRRFRQEPVLVPVISFEEVDRCWAAIRAKHGGKPADMDFVNYRIVKARDQWWFIVQVTDVGHARGVTANFVGVPCTVQVVWSTDRRMGKKFTSILYRRSAWTTKALCHYCGGSVLDHEHEQDCDRPRKVRPRRRLAHSVRPIGHFWEQMAAWKRRGVKLAAIKDEASRRKAYLFG